MALAHHQNTEHAQHAASPCVSRMSFRCMLRHTRKHGRTPSMHWRSQNHHRNRHCTHCSVMAGPLHSFSGQRILKSRVPVFSRLHGNIWKHFTETFRCFMETFAPTTAEPSRSTSLSENPIKRPSGFTHEMLCFGCLISSRRYFLSMS